MSLLYTKRLFPTPTRSSPPNGVKSLRAPVPNGPRRGAARASGTGALTAAGCGQVDPVSDASWGAMGGFPTDEAPALGAISPARPAHALRRALPDGQHAGEGCGLHRVDLGSVSGLTRGWQVHAKDGALGPSNPSPQSRSEGVKRLKLARLVQLVDALKMDHCLVRPPLPRRWRVHGGEGG